MLSTSQRLSTEAATDRMRVVVVLNPSSGPANQDVSEQSVAAAFRLAGIEPEIILLRQGIDLQNLLTDRVREGVRTIVAGGGDGTISTVARVLAGTDTSLGVLPIGTLNHFAKDLAIPLELGEAIRVIGEGQSMQVDVAEVNGQVFLNNSSIGLYPTSVLERERLMAAGWPKGIAMCIGAMRALWRFPDVRVRVTTEEGGLVTKTPFLFVGNNKYEFTGLQAGTRSTLTDGRLQLCTVQNPTRATLLKAVLFAVFGKLNSVQNALSVDTEWAHVRTFRRHIKVALDGEVVRMTSPLTYTIRRAALRVFVPRTS